MSGAGAARAGWEAAATPAPRPRRRLVVHVGLFALTALTTTLTGAAWEGVDPLDSFGALARGLPFSTTLLAILLCHEFGHYLMCRYHGVQASLPYFLPGIPLPPLPGTFGAFIRIRSRFPDRRALFDIGAGGPWAGFVVAVAVSVVGFRLSHVAAGPLDAGVVEFGDSLLTTALAHLVLHADPASVVLHPVALAGWFGLFVTSLNLVPVGQLDGGHILYAALGRDVPIVPGVLMGVLVWLGLRGFPGWLLWAAIVVLMSTLGHPATERDARPLGRVRLIASAASLILFVVTFVPEPIRIIP